MSVYDVAWEDDARSAYALARSKCILLGDDYVGTQHLLLGLIAVSPTAQIELTTLNEDSVVAAVIETIGIRDANTVLVGSVGCQTPRVKLAIERAAHRAKEESRAVSCVDLWVGLLEDRDSDCQKVFSRLGVDAEALLRRMKT